VKTLKLGLEARQGWGWKPGKEAGAGSQGKRLEQSPGVLWSWPSLSVTAAK